MNWYVKIISKNFYILTNLAYTSFPSIVLDF